MTGRHTVSVALCTHNGASFVGAQLRSILAQSEPPEEVVVSDDASRDATIAEIEGAWAGAGPRPRLRLLRNERPLGVVANFEQAVAACRSDLIALCDQDDTWHPARLARVRDVFAGRPELELVFGDARLVDVAGVPLGASLFEALEVSRADLAAIRRGDGFRALLRRNLVTGATTVFRRELLDRTRPFPAEWVHDEWLAILAAAGGTIDYLEEALIDYRQHASNQIGIAVPTLRYKMRRMLEPRGDRYATLVLRAETLRDRLIATEARPEVLRDAEGKLAHQRIRATLPRSRVMRVVPVLREAATGRYARYSSRGRLDILRDLLQPAS